MMKPAVVCALLALSMSMVATAAQAQTPLKLPIATVPAGCAPILMDIDLCGAGGQKCVVHSPRPVAAGVARGRAKIMAGPSGLLVQADHMLFSKSGRHTWGWAPVPEREGVVHGDRRGLWFARSTAPVPTLRLMKGGKWRTARPSPDAGPGWRFHEAGCPMAVRAKQVQEGDGVRTRVEVSFWTGRWSPIWRAGFPGMGPVRIFPGQKTLHVFFQKGGPKGHTLFYGTAGGEMKPLIGPTEDDGKPFQLSGQGLWFAEANAGTFVVVESLSGIRHLDLSTGTFTWIARQETIRKTSGDILTQTWHNPHGVAFLATQRGARFIYTVSGGSRTERIEQAEPGSRRRPPPAQKVETESWQLHSLVDLDALDQPQQIPGPEALLGATIGSQNHIQLLRAVYKNRGDQRSDLYAQTLSIQKTLGLNGPRQLLDVQQTRTEKVDLDMDDEHAFFEAGFNRWGLGTTVLNDGIARMTTDSYEEWMPAGAQGLLKDGPRAWVFETRMRVVSQDVKSGSPRPGQTNAGIRISGLGYDMALRFTRGGVLFVYNGQRFMKEGLDMTRFRTFKIEAEGDKITLWMDGEMLTRGTSASPVKGDRLWMTFGALGGTVKSTTEWDYLRLKPL